MSSNTLPNQFVRPFCTLPAEHASVSVENPAHRSSEIFGTFLVECTRLHRDKRCFAAVSIARDLNYRTGWFRERAQHAALPLKIGGSGQQVPFSTNSCWISGALLHAP